MRAEAAAFDVDDDMRAVLEELRALGRADVPDRPLPSARKAVERLHEAFDAPPEPVDAVIEVTIPVDGTAIPGALYRPSGNSGGVAFFHGGGWALGSISTHDRLCRALANRTGMSVLSVEYRLSPEHKFPVPALDCYYASLWFAGESGLLPSNTPLVVMGDSAGGNLAVAVSQLARRQGVPTIGLQVLLYPALSPFLDTRSHAEYGNGEFMLTSRTVAWCWEQYLGSLDDRADPLAVPLVTDAMGEFPPTIVVTAECDPLRDEAEIFAEALRRAGVPAKTWRFPGMIHDFLCLRGRVRAARLALDELSSAILTEAVVTGCRQGSPLEGPARPNGGEIVPMSGEGGQLKP